MDDLDLSYLEELDKEPEIPEEKKVLNEKVNKVTSLVNDEDFTKEYGQYIEDSTSSKTEDKVEYDFDELKKLREDTSDDDEIIFDDEDESDKKEPEVQEKEDSKKLYTNENIEKQKALRKELDKLTNSTFDRVIVDEPELSDYSEEGIKQYKEDIIEFNRQQEIRKQINLKSRELGELDAKYGTAERQEFVDKFNKIANSTKEKYKDYNDNFVKFAKEINEHFNSIEDEAQKGEIAKKLGEIDVMILDDENSEALLYHYTRFPDEYKKLLAMSTNEMIKKISKLSTTIELKRNSSKKSQNVEVTKPLETSSNVTKGSKVTRKQFDEMKSKDEIDKFIKDNWSKIQKGF